MWLMKKCEVDFSVDKYDDPNTSVNKMVRPSPQPVVASHYPSSPPPVTTTTATITILRHYHRPPLPPSILTTTTTITIHRHHHH
jgi:hypothetical protein